MTECKSSSIIISVQSNREVRKEKAKKPAWLSFLSFAPAVAYLILESISTPKIAILGGIAISSTEILIEWIFFRVVQKLSWLNFILIAGLGGISLAAGNGIWFKLQPTFTGVLFFLLLWISVVRNRPFLYSLVILQRPELSTRKDLFMILEKSLALFLLSFGLMMAPVAIYATTAQWVFMKTIGFYVCFLIYLVFQWYKLKKLRRP